MAHCHMALENPLKDYPAEVQLAAYGTVASILGLPVTSGASIYGIPVVAAVLVLVTIYRQFAVSA